MNVNDRSIIEEVIVVSEGNKNTLCENQYILCYSHESKILSLQKMYGLKNEELFEYCSKFCKILMIYVNTYQFTCNLSIVFVCCLRLRCVLHTQQISVIFHQIL